MKYLTAGEISCHPHLQRNKRPKGSTHAYETKTLPQMKHGHEMKTLTVLTQPFQVKQVTTTFFFVYIIHTNCEHKVNNNCDVQCLLQNATLVLFVNGSIVHVTLFQFYGGKEGHILISVRLQG